MSRKRWSGVVVCLVAVITSPVWAVDCPLWATLDAEVATQCSLAPSPQYTPDTLDVDENGIPDRWELALLSAVLCNPSHPDNAGAVAAWDANWTIMEPEWWSGYGVGRFWTGMVTMSQALIDAYSTGGPAGQSWFDALAVQPYTSAGIEPFAPSGDLDNDGQTNLEEAGQSASMEAYVANAGGFAVDCPLWPTMESELATQAGWASPPQNTPETLDVDGNGLSDRWELALLVHVLCNASHPHHAGVTAAWDANWAILEPEWWSSYGVARFWTAMVTMGQDVIDAYSTGGAGGQSWFDTLPVQPYTVAKSVNEPFSAQGDLDGDGRSNFVEAQTSASWEEYVINAAWIRNEGPSHIYHSLAQFSSVQGEGNWYYLYWDHADSQMKEMTWSAVEERWESDSGAWIDKTRQKSTVAHDAVRAWRAPGDGTIRTSSIAYIGVACYGGDDTVTTIEVNDTVVWGPLTTTGGEEQPNLTFEATADVLADDWVYYRVASVGPDDSCNARTITPRIGFMSTSSGVAYVDFDDGFSGPLSTAGTLTGNGTISISEGRAQVSSRPPTGTWAGAHLCYGTLCAMPGDFSAQILLPIADQVTYGTDVVYCGIAVEVAGTVAGDGDGSRQYAFCGPARNPSVPGNETLRMTQAGLGGEYTLAGEAISAVTAIAVKVIRNGDTLELWAAYDGDAPPEGDPTTGIFHLVNSQAISGPVTGIFVYSYRSSDAIVVFDDFRIEGAGVLDFQSPATGPEVPANVAVENDIGLVGSPSLLGDPVWSHDGKRVAFVGQLYYDRPRGIHVYNFETRSITTLLEESDEVFNMAVSGMAWSPDDNHLYFASMLQDDPHDMLNRCNTYTANQHLGPGEIENVLRVGDVVPGRDGRIHNPCIVSTEQGYKLLFCTEIWGDYTEYYGLLYRDIDETGNFTSEETHRVMHWYEYVGLFSGLSVSPSGENLVMAIGDAPYENRVLLVVGIRDILLGNTLPVESYADPRVIVVDDDPYFKTWPRFSQDGTKIIYSKDFSGRFIKWGQDQNLQHHAFGNSFECDFDLMFTSVEDVFASQAPTRIPKWANQLRVQPSEGGTRLVWVDDSFNYLIGSTLRFTGSVAVAGGVTAGAFMLGDGSGTTLSIPAGTAVTGLDPGATSLSISVYTPISPLEEALLGPGGVPVVRDYAPNGLQFEPPASMIICYNDGEVRGLDESTLQVVRIPASGVPELLPVSERNPDGNYVIVPTPGFSQFGLGGGFEPGSDTDGDGLLDEEESADLDPNTPGVQNPFNPFAEDTTGDNFDPNPDGIPDGANDWDGDGMSNEDEFEWDFNPLDPTSWATVPVAPFAAVLFVFLALLAIGMKQLLSTRIMTR